MYDAVEERAQKPTKMNLAWVVAAHDEGALAVQTEGWEQTATEERELLCWEEWAAWEAQVHGKLAVVQAPRVGEVLEMNAQAVLETVEGEVQPEVVLAEAADLEGQEQTQWAVVVEKVVGELVLQDSRRFVWVSTVVLLGWEEVWL